MEEKVSQDDFFDLTEITESISKKIGEQYQSSIYFLVNIPEQPCTK